MIQPLVTIGGVPKSAQQALVYVEEKRAEAKKPPLSAQERVPVLAALTAFDTAGRTFPGYPALKSAIVAHIAAAEQAAEQKRQGAALSEHLPAKVRSVLLASSIRAYISGGMPTYVFMGDEDFATVYREHQAASFVRQGMDAKEAKASVADIAVPAGFRSSTDHKIYIPVGQNTAEVDIHEALHHYSHARNKESCGHIINEGVTQYLTKLVCSERAVSIAGNRYVFETQFIEALVSRGSIALAALCRDYFQGSGELLAALTALAARRDATEAKIAAALADDGPPAAASAAPSTLAKLLRASAENNRAAFIKVQASLFATM